MLCGCSRRFMLGGAVATLSTVATRSATLAQDVPKLTRQCALQQQALNKSDWVSTFGKPKIDKALIAELKQIINIIPIDPGFKYIPDGDRPNAFATTDTIVAGTRGTVVFGINLVQQEMQDPSQHGGVAVAGISAHECGHIFQFYSKYYQVLAGN